MHLDKLAKSELSPTLASGAAWLANLDYSRLDASPPSPLMGHASPSHRCHRWDLHIQGNLLQSCSLFFPKRLCL